MAGPVDPVLKGMYCFLKIPTAYTIIMCGLEYAKKVSDHDELATAWIDGSLVDMNDAVFELCDVDSYAIDFRPPLLKK